MKRGAPILLAALAVAALAAPGAAARGLDDSRLANAESWAFAIGNGMLAGDAEAVATRLGDHDLVVVDGELARRADVEALHERDTTTLAYLSVGTIEKWRGWFKRVKPFRLAAWRDWRDEWFADVSKRKLRRIIFGAIAPRILRKGFDGLFLDNVDMIEARRHRAQRKGMRRLVVKLERLVESSGGLLFAQNGFRGLRKFGIRDHLDGWNREDVTWTWDFDRRRYVRNKPRDVRTALDELARMRARGIFVTATDYTRRSAGPAAAEAVANACEVPALPYVSDIGLTAKRLPEPPLTC